jgi:hypothetical protein
LLAEARGAFVAALERLDSHAHDQVVDRRGRQLIDCAADPLTHQLDVRPIGGRIGDAAGLHCDAANVVGDAVGTQVVALWLYGGVRRRHDHADIGAVSGGIRHDRTPCHVTGSSGNGAVQH